MSTTPTVVRLDIEESHQRDSLYNFDVIANESPCAVVS